MSLCKPKYGLDYRKAIENSIRSWIHTKSTNLWFDVSRILKGLTHWSDGLIFLYSASNHSKATYLTYLQVRIEANSIHLTSNSKLRTIPLFAPCCAAHSCCVVLVLHRCRNKMAPRARAARPRADGADAKGWREEKGRDIYAGIWQGQSRTFYIPLQVPA